jgi:hypothetical protein
VTVEQITERLDQPFYTGSGTTAVIDEVGLHCSINGRGFIVDFREEMGYYHRYQQTGVNLLNTQQSSSGGDLAQVPPEVWRRSVETWHAGAGQTHYDRDGSDPKRFRDSSGVDVWSPWKMSLLPDTALLHGLPAGISFLSTVGVGQLVAAADVDLYWWGTDLTLAPTHVVSPDGAIADVTSDGGSLYTLSASGVVRRWTAPGSSTVFASSVPVVGARTVLRYLKGFLVLGAGNQLYDVSTGAAVLIYTHPNAGVTWVDACEGSAAAYLVGGQGDRWHVFAMVPKPDATGFDPPLPAAPIPEGEVANAIGSYLGYVLVGLNVGWRFGVPDTSGLNVNLGRLVQTDSAVHCFEGQDRFVWYGRSADLTTDPAGLGRADLSTFTAALTPAYADDLATTVAVGTVRRVTTFSAGPGTLGKRVFTVDGVGVYVQSDDLVPEGWLRTGALTLSTSDAKEGLYTQLYSEPLHGQVVLDASYDGGPDVELTTYSSAGGSSAGRIRVETTFNTFEAKLMLRRDPTDPTLGPIITRFELRVLPVAGDSTEFRVPLVISEEYGMGSSQVRDPQSDIDWLRALYQSKQPFVFRIGAQRYRVYMVDFKWLPEKLTFDGRALQGTFIGVWREIA